MANWLPIVTFIVLFLFFIGYIIFSVVINKKKKKAELMPNSPIAVNLSRLMFTQGYAIFSVKTQKPNKNGTILLEGFPFDVEQGEDIPDAPMVSVVVLDGYIKRLPRGGKSSQKRELLFLTSRNPLDYPEELRDTTEGDWMTKEGQMAWVLENIGKIIPSGDEAIAKLVEHFNRGQLSDQALQKLGEDFNILVDLAISKAKEKDEKKE